jgi:hypothetical protein
LGARGLEARAFYGIIIKDTNIKDTKLERADAS